MKFREWVAAPFAAKTPKDKIMLNLDVREPERKSYLNGGRHGVTYAGVVEMSPEEWASIPANPRQRDTATRAKRASHLMELHPSHSMVHMARLPNTAVIKVDGHTRDFIWANNMAPAPDMLHVHVWDVPDIEAAKDLYSTFDSQSAVETVSDKMFGGTNELGLKFESDVLKARRYANALRITHELLFGKADARSYSIHDLLRYWTPELKLFDACDPNRKRFTSGVTAGALITFRRYGPDAQDFWTMYANGAGSKVGGEMDAVQALEERITRERASKSMSGGRDGVVRLVCIILSAFDRHLSDETYSVAGSGIKALKSVSFRHWLAKAKTTPRKW